MIAVDTNVLARLLLKDDDEPYRAAVALFSTRASLTAPPTVLLELVWVLEANRCSRVEIVAGLRLLFGLANFKPMAAAALGQALEWFEAGMDFADALHLALCAGQENLATFDKPFAKLAKKLAASPAVTVVTVDR